MKTISINSLPPSLKQLALVFPNTEVHECEDMNEILKVNETDPLEMTVINQTKKGVIERHFYVGVALDMDVYKPKSERLPPRFYFALMNDNQYDKYKDIVERHLLNDPNKFLI
jgi:hypothetical protein